MKTFLSLTTVVFCGFAPFTSRATSLSMLFSGIPGESTDPATLGEVLVDGLGMNGPLFSGSAAEFTMENKVNATTPLLMRNCAQGTHIRDSILSVRRDAVGGRPGSLQCRISFEDLLVTGMEQKKAQGDGLCGTSTHFRCASVFYRYYLETQIPVVPVFMNLQSSGPDTDRDGMSDAFERHFHLNPKVNDAAEDLDGDGLSNLEEARLGYNPDSGDSFFSVAVRPVPGVPAQIELSWEAIPGKPYQIEWSSDLTRFAVVAMETPESPKAVRRLDRTGQNGFYRVRPTP